MSHAVVAVHATCARALTLVLTPKGQTAHLDVCNDSEVQIDVEETNRARGRRFGSGTSPWFAKWHPSLLHTPLLYFILPNSVHGPLVCLG